MVLLTVPLLWLYILGHWCNRPGLVPLCTRPWTLIYSLGQCFVSLGAYWLVQGRMNRDSTRKSQIRVHSACNWIFLLSDSGVQFHVIKCRATNIISQHTQIDHKPTDYIGLATSITYLLNSPSRRPYFLSSHPMLSPVNNETLEVRSCWIAQKGKMIMCHGYSRSKQWRWQPRLEVHTAQAAIQLVSLRQSSNCGIIARSRNTCGLIQNNRLGAIRK